MTTDIIELAQREKFEAWFKSSFHPDKTGPYIKDQLYFAWKAAGAELVEALEKAQQLATQQGNIACALFDEVTAQRQRIAELESSTVTVKLASRRLPSDYVDGEFGNDDLAAIHNACRLECKVSVEKYLSAHGIVVKWEDE